MITQFFLVLAQDSTPPQYSLNSTNSTAAGKPVEFRLKWADDVGLSGYIFSTNNTGTWFNDSFTKMTGTGNWSNVTLPYELSIDNDTVALWHFNSVNTTNYTLDESDNHNDGYLGNGNSENVPSLVGGKLSNGLQFDGSDDYILVPNSSSLALSDDTFTIEVWVKTSSQTNQGIFDKYSWNINLYLYDDGIVEFYVWAKTGDDIDLYSTTNISDGDWHHIAAVVDKPNSIGKLYIDGVEEDSTASGTTETYTDGDIYIGTDTWDYFNGIIDEVKIYNRSLSADEIYRDYATSLPLNSTEGTLIQWKVYANDTSDNWNASEEFSFVTPDETSPQVTILSPSNISYPNNTIWFNVTLNEAGSVCLVEISGTNHTLTNSTGNWNYLNNTLSDGNYTTSFYCNDTAGNMGIGDISFTIDKDPPHIEFIPPTPGNDTYTNKNYTYVNVSVEDVGQTSSFIDWDRSLVGYWAMDWYKSTGVYDNSTYNNFGTFNGGLGTDNITTGKFGSALEFDGDNDYVNVTHSDSLNITQEITLESWVYLSELKGINPILRKGSTFIHDLNEDGVVDGLDLTIVGFHYGSLEGEPKYWRRADINGNGVVDMGDMNIVSVNLGDSTELWSLIQAENVTESQNRNYKFLFSLGESRRIVSSRSLTSDDVGKWFYIAATYNGSSLSLYINGQLDSSVSATGNINSTSENLHIGNATYLDTFNGTIDEIRIWNRSLTQEQIKASYNSSVYRLYHNFTNLREGSHECYAYAIDIRGNSNTSSTRLFTIDISPPTFNVMTLTPSSEADVDPNVQINITTNVTDELVGMDTVIFQYKQEGAGTWINDTMDYNSGTGLYENASLTPTLPGTWNYRIWANDTVGNADIYNETNLSVQYEYTWTRSPASFGVVSGIITTTSDVGVLTINNTGDYTLNFDLSSNWGNIFYNVTEPFDLAAKGVKVINVTATFSGATREDDITITIDATSANADPSDSTTNATLASYTGGPYFDVSIVTYSAVVAQSQSGIILSSKLRNIGNETATNTWLNWTLPTGWTNTSGNLTQNISNLTVGSTAWNNLTVNIDPETASATEVTITVAASSTENITDSYSESITVICNSTDGVCGLGCTAETDTDCQTRTTTESSGAGGVGGGRAPSITSEQREKLFQTQETYELVRGREQNFTLKVENQLNGILENVEVSISGFLAQYLRVKPKLVERITINRSFDFTIWIEAPKYFTRGEHNLNFTITGTVNKTRIIESRLVTLIIYEVSREEAESYLNESVKLIEEMKNYELNTKEVENLLSKARDNFNNKNYEEVKILYESIKEKKEEAFETLSLLEDLKKMLKEAEYKGLEVPKTGRLILLSKAALDRGDYELALKRADDARTTYALETLGKFNFRAFIGNNWPEVSVAIIGLSISLCFAIFSIRFNFINERLKELKEEEGILLDLIKEVQRECFERGKLSMKEYMETLIQYEKRFNQVIQETIKLETKKTYLFKPFKKEDERLLEERKKLLNLIKETQRLYLEAGKLESRIYENRMKSYAERLAEIEEKLATLEAKKVVKKSKFYVLVEKMKSIFR